MHCRPHLVYQRLGLHAPALVLRCSAWAGGLRHITVVNGVAACAQVLGVTSRGRLPQASVTLMGAGLMEWSRERDRTINVCAGDHALLPSFTRCMLLLPRR